MTAQVLYAANFTDPVTGHPVTMTLHYDDVTLALLDCVYTNPSAQPGTVTLLGPVTQTITSLANTAVKTVDLTPSGVTCQKIVKFSGQTIVVLPAGEDVQFSWGPAPAAV